MGYKYPDYDRIMASSAPTAAASFASNLTTWPCLTAVLARDLPLRERCEEL